MQALEGTYVLDVVEVMELERRIEAAGTPMVDLMRKAGAAVAHSTKEELACLVASACEIDSEGAEAGRDEAPLRQKVVVFAGGGNNLSRSSKLQGKEPLCSLIRINCQPLSLRLGSRVIISTQLRCLKMKMNSKGFCLT